MNLLNDFYAFQNEGIKNIPSIRRSGKTTTLKQIIRLHKMTTNRHIILLLPHLHFKWQYTDIKSNIDEVISIKSKARDHFHLFDYDVFSDEVPNAEEIVSYNMPTNNYIGGFYTGQNIERQVSKFEVILC